LTDRADGVVVSIWVTPRSIANKVGGIEGNELRIYVTAPPLEGAANAAAQRVLADAFQVPKSSIEIISGHASRHKRMLIRGVGAARLQSLLKTLIRPT
jgi:uncharacterized protein (TIGR00251 family)